MGVQKVRLGLIAGIDRFRDFVGATDVPVQHFLCFLYVADRQELPMADLMAVARTSQSAVSRAVAKLGQGESPSDPGWGLVEAYEDPYFRRRKLVRITPKGKELMNEIA